LDTDTNGVLSETEFKQMIEEMKVTTSGEDIEKLLEIIDPYNNKQVTFSECLALLSSVSYLNNL
jgi:Ca2+-binding EF-hand superfamily protein